MIIHYGGKYLLGQSYILNVCLQNTCRHYSFTMLMSRYVYIVHLTNHIICSQLFRYFKVKSRLNAKQDLNLYELVLTDEGFMFKSSAVSLFVQTGITRVSIKHVRFKAQLRPAVSFSFTLFPLNSHFNAG